MPQRKYEYGYCHESVPFWMWNEAMDFGIVYARDIKEARLLAWNSIPYDYTIHSVKEVF